MRYKGMTLEEFRSNKLFGFDCNDEYEALRRANRKWDKASEENAKEEPRLLVIESIDAKCAFFQFTSYDACEKFICKKHEIIWGDKKSTAWPNGDATIMSRD